jgi:uncharacterized membrane protein YagU involved in acid resistance
MRLLKAILVGGLIAGVLDITYAFIVYGPLSYQMTPVQILQSVAAGWVGHDAADAGGTAMAVLGLGTHFMIAITMAAVFVLCSQQMPALQRNPVLWGFLYGLGLYAVMTYLVVPLSAAHRSQHFAASLQEVISRLQVSFSSVRPKDRWQLLGTLLTHTAFVGIPISLINKRTAIGQ